MRYMIGFTSKVRAFFARFFNIAPDFDVKEYLDRKFHSLMNATHPRSGGFFYRREEILDHAPHLWRIAKNKFCTLLQEHDLSLTRLSKDHPYIVSELIRHGHIKMIIVESECASNVKYDYLKSIQVTVTSDIWNFSINNGLIDRHKGQLALETLMSAYVGVIQASKITVTKDDCKRAMEDKVELLDFLSSQLAAGAIDCYFVNTMGFQTDKFNHAGEQYIEYECDPLVTQQKKSEDPTCDA